MLLYNTNFWRLWERRSSYMLLRCKTISFKKTFSTMLQVFESRLQWTQTLPSQVLLLKTHSGINNLFSDKWEYLEGTANLRFWHCWLLSSICDYHESKELSGWYSINPHWSFQRSLCAGVWFDFNAGSYWKLPLTWTCWRPTGTAAKFYLSSWKRYWTHCIGWTNVIGCSWQVWCCMEDCVKRDNYAP